MSCASIAEEGIWVPREPSNNITRIEIHLNCQDQVLNGQPYPPGPPYFIHIWGSCHPHDCEWGQAPYSSRLSTGQIYAFYDQGFSKRYIYTAVVEPGVLWVNMHTIFTDPNRAAYTIDNWFKPENGVSPRLRALTDISRKKRVEKGERPSAFQLDLDPFGSNTPNVSKLNPNEIAPLPAVLAPKA